MQNKIKYSVRGTTLPSTLDHSALIKRSVRLGYIKCRPLDSFWSVY